MSHNHCPDSCFSLYTATSSDVFSWIELYLIQIFPSQKITTYKKRTISEFQKIWISKSDQIWSGKDYWTSLINEKKALFELHNNRSCLPMEHGIASKVHLIIYVNSIIWIIIDVTETRSKLFVEELNSYGTLIQSKTPVNSLAN